MLPIAKHLYSGMFNGSRSIYPSGLNKGFGSKFCVGSRVRHETPEEARRTHRSKHCGYNYKYEDTSPNTQSGKDHY